MATYARREPREQHDLRAVAHHRVVQRRDREPSRIKNFSTIGLAAYRAMTKETPTPVAHEVETSATPKGVPDAPGRRTSPRRAGNNRERSHRHVERPERAGVEDGDAMKRRRDARVSGERTRRDEESRGARTEPNRTENRGGDWVRARGDARGGGGRGGRCDGSREGSSARHAPLILGRTSSTKRSFDEAYSRPPTDARTTTTSAAPRAHNARARATVPCTARERAPRRAVPRRRGALRRGATSERAGTPPERRARPNAADEGEEGELKGRAAAGRAGARGGTKFGPPSPL